MLSATLLHMQDVNSSRKVEPRQLVINTDRQARLLEDRATVDIMRPFWERPCSIAEAAQELKRPINSVHYRVIKLLKADLLEVTDTMARAGRPIRLYRTVADRFLIPDEHRQQEESERMLTDIEPTLIQIARGLTKTAAIPSGRRLYLDRDSRIISERYSHTHDGSLVIGHQPSQQTTGAVQYGTVDLSNEDAKAFQAELKALVENYTRQKRQNPSVSTGEYSFVVAIART